jgi:hypothetical protein
LSWSSCGHLLKTFFAYGADARHALKSAPAFAQLLRLLAEHTNAENINILTYSAGVQIASPGLDIIGRNTKKEKRCGSERSILRQPTAAWRTNVSRAGSPDTGDLSEENTDGSRMLPWDPGLRDEAFIKIPISLAFLSVLFAATLVT